MTDKQIQEMRKVWERFVAGQGLDSQRLRQQVANSWRRCHRLQVDPHNAHQPRTIQLTGQNKNFEHLQQLIKVAQPVMENLHSLVGDTGFQVVLADSHGTIVSQVGGQGSPEDMSLGPMRLGDDWSEATRGTNAIGTCLVEQKPIQIHGFEHYCESNHDLACSAAPIFKPDGSLIGILNVSGDCHLDSLHTLAMVAAGAKAIENKLRLIHTRNKLRTAYQDSTTIINAMWEALVTVDTQGKITKINDAAAQIFDVDANNVVGWHVSNLVGPQAPILELLKTGIGYKEKEVFLEAQGFSIFSSGCLLYDDQGTNTGAIAIIRAPSVDLKPKPKPKPKQKPHHHVAVASTYYTLDTIIGESDVINEAKRRVEIAAQSPSTVLLLGESGTGKEMFAQSIHRCGNRREQPFVAINCAATPENLIESELFGYEEGAFTGAKKGGKPGNLEEADGGTLFLDEVGDMPIHVQVKLLRVLQERKVKRVGSNSEIPVDIRVIAATHKNLPKEIKAGRFRTDLYFRLNVLCISIPSLRDRLQDLPLLIKALTQRLSEKLGRDNITVDESFLRACYVYPWPGNIRELENILERAINMSGPEGVLTAELMELHTELETDGEVKRQSKVRPLKELEREMIELALSEADGNVSKATMLLGISRNTIYRKIKEHHIELK
ncbi:MAG: sigma-54-dependent Fis family transcriptional regulator [Desulfuromonas sp.]|nr:sigma-54-dependent Fis family transcriptional regulator [Desulfuromonas sp.]